MAGVVVCMAGHPNISANLPPNCPPGLIFQCYFLSAVPASLWIRFHRAPKLSCPKPSAFHPRNETIWAKSDGGVPCAWFVPRGGREDDNPVHAEAGASRRNHPHHQLQYRNRGLQEPQLCALFWGLRVVHSPPVWLNQYDVARIFLNARCSHPRRRVFGPEASWETASTFFL